MKKLFTSILFAIVLVASASIAAKAQCTAAQTNWDNLDYYYNSGLNLAPYGYKSGGNKTYITDAMEQAQKFAIGTNWFSVVTSTAGLVNPGAGISAENALHTGDLPGYTGEDVQYNPSAVGETITITFNTEVTNVSFTLYDIDRAASIVVGAANAVPAAVPVGVATQPGTILTVTGGATKTITDLTNTALANNSNMGSASITVAGPVKTIVISILGVGTDPVFWLSDINACVTGTFPTNWHQSAPNSRPFWGPTQSQPDYFLVTPDNNYAYMVDPATGTARALFNDPAKTYINSFGYDPYNRFLYYVTETAGADRTNKEVKRYDYNTETFSVIIPDITVAPLNVPTFNSGIQSAGCAFYNGSLYFGVEGGNFFDAGTNTYTTRETIIWRIDFDAGNNPVNASQVFAADVVINGNSGSAGTLIHDWGDFIIKNGIIYDFNTAFNADYTQSKYHHFDMMTGAITNTYNNPGTTIWNGQAGMTWTGGLYYFRSTTGAGIPSSVGFYNEAGVNSAPVNITVASGPAWPGNSGDASDPFRPKCDFGDAPASYDPYITPATQSPAVHERTENIRLGATWDYEFLKRGVTGINDVDDGLPFVPLMLQGPTSSYLTQATVFNNSGANATLIAWLDYNNNGVFDAAEGITPITVPSSASNQLVYLYWPGFTTSLIAGQSTYLRIRITSATAAMTTAHATGYFNNGEVEDYRINVSVNFPLSVNLLSFDAKTIDNKAVKLNWSSANEAGLIGYEIERSADGSNWNKLEQIFSKGNGQPGTFSYEYDDINPLKGKSYYRLKMLNADGKHTYSSVKNILIKEAVEEVHISPNPASTKVSVSIKTTEKAVTTITLIDMQGKKVIKQTGILTAGVNDIAISNFESLPAGVYTVQITVGQKIINQKLIKK
jgi:GEVED domain/Secretion system C-terminal sorting domain